MGRVGCGAVVRFVVGGEAKWEQCGVRHEELREAHQSCKCVLRSLALHVMSGHFLTAECFWAGCGRRWRWRRRAAASSPTVTLTTPTRQRRHLQPHGSGDDNTLTTTRSYRQQHDHTDNNTGARCLHLVGPTPNGR